MKDLGPPEDMFTFINYPTRFDCRGDREALKGSGIACPKLPDYAWRLWDYWERHLDPDLHIDRSLRGPPAARWCSSPAARPASAWRRPSSFAEAGAITIICGRDQTSSTPPSPRSSQGRQGRPDPRLRRDIADEAAAAGLVAWLRQRVWRRGLPDQQRRPLHPPRHREQLRPLPLTSSAPCSSTISAACASPWACCPAWSRSARATWSTSAPSAC